MSKSKWILTKDELPKEDTPVLIFVKGEIHIGEIRWEDPTFEETFKAFKYWQDPTTESADWEWHDVTHWMPLPEEPVTEGLQTAYVTVRSGAPGSKESNHCALIIAKMLSTWCTKNGHKVTAARNSVRYGVHELVVSGESIYDQLKTEAGVHRLVRLSPHDPEFRRTTSFTTVEVTPDFVPVVLSPGTEDGEKPIDPTKDTTVRSYVFHPYRIVTDHRTWHTTEDVEAVLDGDLDSFIEARLEQLSLA